MKSNTSHKGGSHSFMPEKEQTYSDGRHSDTVRFYGSSFYYINKENTHIRLIILIN